MFLFGDDYYGTVDIVPGLCFVKTRFLHIWFVPLVPRESLVFWYEQNPSEGHQGIQIPLRWRSVWTAWLQAFLAVAIFALLFIIGGMVYLLIAEGQKMREDALLGASIFIAVMVLLLGLCGYGYWLILRKAGANLERAVELGQHLGLSAAQVEKHFWRVVEASQGKPVDSQQK